MYGFIRIVVKDSFIPRARQWRKVSFHVRAKSAQKNPILFVIFFFNSLLHPLKGTATCTNVVQMATVPKSNQKRIILLLRFKFKKLFPLILRIRGLTFYIIWKSRRILIYLWKYVMYHGARRVLSSEFHTSVPVIWSFLISVFLYSG